MEGNRAVIKNNNTKQAAWVIIGSFTAFGFSIISTMILSRYFDKADYGTYRQIMYIYSTFLGLFTLGLPKAYTFFLPRLKIEGAKDVINKINILLLTLGLFLSGFLYFGADLLANILKNQELSTPLKWFSIVPFFMLPTIGLEGILSTYKKARLLAFYNVSTRVIMLISVTAPIIFFDGTIIHSIIGFSISSFIAFLFAGFLKYYPVRNIESDSYHSVSYSEILKYVKPIFFATVFGIAINASDQFFISRYFGAEVFAEFANGWMELPFVSMIISASGLIVAPIFSKLVFDKDGDYQENVVRLWRSVFSKSIKLIYPIVIFFFCFADIIMTVLYGYKYEDSGIYFQIKLVVNFFTLAMYGPLILSIGGNNFYFKVHLYGAIVLVLFEWIAVKTINTPIAVAIVSVICQIGRIFFLFWYIARYFKIRVIELFPIKLIIELLVPSLIILYPARFLFEYYFELKGAYLLFCSGVLYLVIFSSWIYYRKIEYITIIKPLYEKVIKK